MGDLVDIEEYRKKKEESGSYRKNVETSTIGVFSLLLGPDAPDGLKKYIKKLEQKED